MLINRIILWGKQNPKAFFRIDGIGAIISAVLLGLVLVEFEVLLGIPKNTLYFLALLPCLFALYDFYCYVRIDKKTKLFLKGIALMNVLYCFLSIGLAFYHRNSVTHWGWVYIIVESIIVVSLAIVEFKIAKNEY
jgi:hypothetical protein